jgi:hypothetical protein
MPTFSFEVAMKRAKKIFDGKKHSPVFPEDDCKPIGDNWELNLFLGKNDQPQATLYRVDSDGTTDTASGIPVA